MTLADDWVTPPEEGDDWVDVPERRAAQAGVTDVELPGGELGPAFTYPKISRRRPAELPQGDVPVAEVGIVTPDTASGAAPPAPGEDLSRLGSAGSSFAQGVVGVGASFPKSAAIAEGQRRLQLNTILDQIDAGTYRITGREGPMTGFLIGYEGSSPEDRLALRQDAVLQTDPRQMAPYKTGEAMEQWGKEQFPTHPVYSQEFWAGKVPHAGGSAAGFMGTGLIGAGLRLPAAIPMLIAGAASQGSEQFEDALKHGASLEDAFKASNLGSVVGLSEAIPIMSLLNRLDRKTGGGVRKYLLDVLKQGGEELTQEVFQKLGENLIANQLVAYDPQRGTFTGTGEAGAVGFTVGGLMQMAAGLLAGKRGGARLKPATPEETAAEQAALKQLIAEREAAKQGVAAAPAPSEGLNVPAELQVAPTPATPAIPPAATEQPPLEQVVEQAVPQAVEAIQELFKPEGGVPAPAAPIPSPAAPAATGGDDLFSKLLQGWEESAVVDPSQAPAQQVARVAPAPAAPAPIAPEPAPVPPAPVVEAPTTPEPAAQEPPPYATEAVPETAVPAGEPVEDWVLPEAAAAPAARAAPEIPVQPAPPPSPGFTRFYHGGSDPASGGGRWVTPNYEYARDYRSGEPVSYVDIPNDSPLLKKSFEDAGTDQVAPFVSFEAPAEIAAQLKPYSPPVGEQLITAPEAPAPVETGGLDFQTAIKMINQPAARNKKARELGITPDELLAQAKAVVDRGRAAPQAPAPAPKPGRVVQESPELLAARRAGLARLEEQRAASRAEAEAVWRAREGEAAPPIAEEPTPAPVAKPKKPKPVLTWEKTLAGWKAPGFVIKKQQPPGALSAEEARRQGVVEPKSFTVTVKGQPLGVYYPSLQAAKDAAEAVAQGEEAPIAEAITPRERKKPLPEKGPMTLVQFVMSKGGIDPSSNLIQDLRDKFGGGEKGNLFVPGKGNLIRREAGMGMKLDEMQEATRLNFYTTDTTTKELIEALGSDRNRLPRGQELEAPIKEDEAEKAIQRERKRIIDALAEADIRENEIDQDALNDAARALAGGYDKNPADVYDEAVEARTRPPGEEDAESGRDRGEGEDLGEIGGEAKRPRSAKETFVTGPKQQGVGKARRALRQEVSEEAIGFLREMALDNLGREIEVITAAPLSRFIDELDVSHLENVPRSVAEGFAERLKKVTGDTPVFFISEADLHELSGRSEEDIKTQGVIGGQFRTELGPGGRELILMNADLNWDAHERTKNILHEGTHAAGYGAVEHNPRVKKQLRQLLEATAKRVRNRDKVYAFTDEHEFLSEAAGNPVIQELLHALPASPLLVAQLKGRGRIRTMWDAFVELVRRLVGFDPKYVNLLDAVLDVGGKATREKMFVPEEGPTFEEFMADIEEQIEREKEETRAETVTKESRGKRPQAGTPEYYEMHRKLREGSIIAKIEQAEAEEGAPEAEAEHLVKAFSPEAAAKPPEFKTVRGPEKSDPGYVYHATSRERAYDIAEDGNLRTHKAHEFTDQDAWPDGATEKRNYFTSTAENTWQFAPEDGTPVLLRMKQEGHPIKREKTGDLYSTKPVSADRLEYLGADDNWHPVRPKVEPTVEPGAEGKPQQVIPGAERDVAGALQRQADAGLKPKAIQKAMDIGLFSDESKQEDMFASPANPPPKDRPSLEELSKKYDAIRGDVRKQLEKFDKSPRFEIMMGTKRRLVTKNIGDPKVPYRITYVDEHGPSGHIELRSLDDVATELMRDIVGGFRVVSPKGQIAMFAIRDAGNEAIEAKLAQRNYPKLGKILGFWGQKSPMTSTELRVKVQDVMLRWRRAQEQWAIDNPGQTLPPEMDVYRWYNLAFGKKDKRLRNAERDYIDPIIKEINDRGLTYQEIGDYIYAMHAGERNRDLRAINPQFMGLFGGDPSGMSDAEARGILANARPKQADYDVVYRMFRTMVDATLDMQVADGLITPAAAANWRARWPNYAPLRNTEIGDGWMGIGKGAEIRGREYRPAFGRESRADNPLAFAFAQMQHAIIRGENNQIGKSVGEFVRANPDPNLWRFNTGPRIQFVDKQTGLVDTMTHPNWRARDDVFTWKENGVEQSVWFVDPDYGAKLARALKNLEKGEMNRFLIFASGVTRTMARLATSWNAEFMVSNFFRDAGEAFLLIPAEKRSRLGRRWIRHLLPALWGALRGQWKKPGGGTYAQAFREFESEGGRIGFLGEYGAVSVEKNIKNKMRHAQRGILNPKVAIKAFFESLDMINNAVENGTRLAMYMAAKDVGATRAQAASIAREATVNFNRKGEWGSYMSAAFLFANASVQGPVRMVGALKTSAGVRRRAYGLVGVGAILSLYNMAVGGDADDGTSNYSNIAEWQRDANFILMGTNGKPILMIPAPLGFAMFKAIGDHAMSALFERQRGIVGKSASAIAMAVISAFDPLGRDQGKIAHFTPSALKPLAHLGFNQDAFGRPISPDKHFYNKFLPASHSSFRSASPFSEMTVQELNRLTGGTNKIPGYVDIGAGDLDYMLGFVTGGVGRLGMNAASTIWRGVQGRDMPIEKIPFARRFIGEVSEKSAEKKFFEEREETQKAFQQKRTNDPEYHAAKRFTQVSKSRRDIIKEIDAIEANESLSAVEKDEKIKVKNKEIHKLMHEARRELERERARAEKRAPTFAKGGSVPTPTPRPSEAPEAVSASERRLKAKTKFDWGRGYKEGEWEPSQWTTGPRRDYANPYTGEYEKFSPKAVIKPEETPRMGLQPGIWPDYVPDPDAIKKEMQRYQQEPEKFSLYDQGGLVQVEPEQASTTTTMERISENRRRAYGQEPTLPPSQMIRGLEQAQQRYRTRKRGGLV